jgi:hypothetical protein
MAEFLFIHSEKDATPDFFFEHVLPQINLEKNLLIWSAINKQK